MTELKVSLKQLEFQTSGHPPRYEARTAAVATRLGARKLGYRVIELAPGKRAWPLHHHFVNEEMFLVLDGRGIFRLGGREVEVQEGDVVSAAPGGPDTAHQFVNTSDAPLRYLAVSTMVEPDVMGYPESGKFAVFVGSPAGGSKSARSFEYIGRVGSGLGYWDDE